jgi:hypothetical protein
MSLRFASAEDTVAQKLHWYRRGGESSERQWLDVLGIITVQGNRLDREYLKAPPRRSEWAICSSGRSMNRQGGPMKADELQDCRLPLKARHRDERAAAGLHPVTRSG